MSETSKYHNYYWPLQIGGWLLYETIGAAINGFYMGLSVSIVTLAIVEFVLMLGLSHSIRCRAKSAGWSQLSFLQLLPRILLSTFLAAATTKAILAGVMHWGFNSFAEQEFSVVALLVYTFQAQIMFLLWSLIYFSFHAIRNFQSSEVEKWKLQAAVSDAELIALKAQVNPHFIFNCLNNIRALVLEDSERARDAITKLSDLLRSSIQSNKAERVSIGSELTMVRDYLALEAIHMEERLRYEIEAEPDIDDFEIPPMSIQLLVENAIKHSLSKLPQGGTIHIFIQKSDTNLHIDVRNTGQLIEQSTHSTGIGLKNIRDRLTLLYGSKATLTLENEPEDKVVAKITIPL